MLKGKTKKGLFWIGLLSITFPLAGCVAESDLLYLNDKVNKVEQRLGALEQNVRKQGPDEAASLRRNIADTNAELDRLKRDLEGLKSSLEEIKIRRLNRLETAQQGLLTRISDLESDMAIVRGQLKLESKQYSAEIKGMPQEIGESATPKEPRTITQRESTTAASDTATHPKHQPGAPSVASVSPAQEKQEKSPTLTTPKAQDPLEQAMELYKKGNTREAILLFDSVIKGKGKEESKAEAYYWMAECYMAQKDYEKAILTYQDLIKNYPQSPKIPNALMRQAEAFSEIKDNMSAIILYRQVIKKYPGTQEAKTAERRVEELEKKKR